MATPIKTPFRYKILFNIAKVFGFKMTITRTTKHIYLDKEK